MLLHLASPQIFLCLCTSALLLSIGVLASEVRLGPQRQRILPDSQVQRTPPLENAQGLTLKKEETYVAIFCRRRVDSLHKSLTFPTPSAKIRAAGTASRTIIHDRLTSSMYCRGDLKHYCAVF